MVSLHRGRFVVVDVCGLPKFSHMGKFISKIATFGAVGPHFKARTVKFGVKVWTWDSLPKPNIVKKSLKEVYLFWANLYQKLPISAILGGL